MSHYRLIVIGSSTGGLKALEIVLAALRPNFPLPIAVIQHVASDSTGIIADLLRPKIQIPIQEAEDKDSIKSGTIYVAPPGYHLLVESETSLSLSVDERENYTRPSIDPLFESAADSFTADLIGVILTGSNKDGALGIRKIQDLGGLVIVQDPNSAEASEMPTAAIMACKPDHILTLQEIGRFLDSLSVQQT